VVIRQKGEGKRDGGGGVGEIDCREGDGVRRRGRKDGGKRTIGGEGGGVVGGRGGGSGGGGRGMQEVGGKEVRVEVE